VGRKDRVVYGEGVPDVEGDSENDAGRINPPPSADWSYTGATAGDAHGREGSIEEA
jgi:hypothetical protein